MVDGVGITVVGVVVVSVVAVDDGLGATLPVPDDDGVGVELTPPPPPHAASRINGQRPAHARARKQARGAGPRSNMSARRSDGQRIIDIKADCLPSPSRWQAGHLSGFDMPEEKS